ncbi:calcineurin-like phosphoesterase family protein [Ancylomarina subtilis]|uniref:Calcineurin-like phosphoesterase family protein n=1 Tax=Ancylomarina subtilis TaxID=1639035 RepID=A0A4Q7V8Z8_9BACT|nr:metallophosphoesterase [Ancylomarina subtilis]RZT91088.1 calcineurin-like phosphoesterase family protein [Ancylomarina subtilis]
MLLILVSVLINIAWLIKPSFRIKGFVLFLSVFLCVCVSQAQKKKRLDSGAFSSYDKIFKGDVDKINLPNYVDGPHFFWLSDDRVKVWYVSHKHAENSIDVKEKLVKIKKDSILFKGLYGDRNRYWLKKKKIVSPKAEYSGVDSIMVVGDVHGEFDTMKTLLIANQVIDKKGNWQFGKNHLVFVGDIFDRGDQVTEALYFIQILSRKAQEQGGCVHLILGNHEVMILMNDTRYISGKYRNMSKRLLTNYYNFFAENTDMGRWLRSLNSVIKINDKLFVHGGLSHDVVEKNLSIDQINEDIRYSLLNARSMSAKELKQKIYFPGNPLWYRGYMRESRYYSRITDKELDEVLSFYGAKQIMFGHTELDEIKFFYQKKICALNVPMGYLQFRPQILLIVGDHFYRCLLDGEKEYIK